MLCTACFGRTGRWTVTGWTPCGRCNATGDEPRRRMPLLYDRARQERGQKASR